MPELLRRWPVVTGKRRKVVGSVDLTLERRGNHAVVPIKVKGDIKFIKFPFVLEKCEARGPILTLTYALDASRVKKKYLKIFLKTFGAKRDR